MASSKCARNHLADEKLDLFHNELQRLKADVGHDYETFFRLSQISKEWKMSVGDQCRRCLEKLMAYGEIWNVIGSISLPDYLGEIGKSLEDLKSTGEAQPRSSSSLKKTPSLQTTKPRAVSVSAAAAATKVALPDAAPRSRAATKPEAMRTTVRARSVSTPVPTLDSSRVSAKGIPPSKLETTQDEGFFSELRQFESQMMKYNAGIMANEHLKAIVNELKAMLKLRRREPHLTKLHSFLRQLDTEMNASEALKLIELQRFHQVKDELAKLRTDLSTSQRAETAQFLPDLSELARAFRDLQENSQKKAYETVVKLAERITGKATGADAEPESQNVLVEMKVVQSRILQLRGERKSAKRHQLQEIEAEIDALMLQQTGLIDRIASFRPI
jgi:hypothetical protein